MALLDQIASTILELSGLTARAIIGGGRALSVYIENGITATMSGAVEIENDEGNPVPVSAIDFDIRNLSQAQDSVQSYQATHDNLNVNANLQVGNTDVSTSNPVPTSLPTSNTSNTPAILTSGGDVISANASRKLWTIQNLSTNPLFVRFGTGASSSVFHVVLKSCSVADDGTGGYFSDEIWKGVVSATGSSPRFVVTELT